MAPQLEKQLERLGLTKPEKDEYDRKWQGPAQTGMQIDPYDVLPQNQYTKVLLVHSSGEQFFFQEYGAPTLYWAKEFYVQGAQNRKDAILLAKIYVINNIDRVRLSGRTKEFTIAFLTRDDRRAVAIRAAEAQKKKTDATVAMLAQAQVNDNCSNADTEMMH